MDSFEVEARRARLREAVGVTSADVDPAQYVEGVMGMIDGGGFQGWYRSHPHPHDVAAAIEEEWRFPKEIRGRPLDIPGDSP